MEPVSVDTELDRAASLVQAVGALMSILRSVGTDALKHAAIDLLHTLAMNNHMRSVSAAIPHIVELLGIPALKQMADELLETLAGGGYASVIEQARARRNWATVRAFVRLRACTFFWHSYVGKQLCKHGGKWAKCDCAAFENEFTDRWM